MQRECNTMVHVLVVLLNLTVHIIQFFAGENIELTNEATVMLRDIEKRWHREENPLFFLAFALHPAFRECATTILRSSLNTNGNWSDDKNMLSYSRLVQAGRFYFRSLSCAAYYWGFHQPARNWLKCI